MRTTVRNAPPAPERLRQAEQLFADGASQTEVHRTTGINRGTLRKYFPGQGWTHQEGGQFRAFTKNTPVMKGI